MPRTAPRIYRTIPQDSRVPGWWRVISRLPRRERLRWYIRDVERSLDDATGSQHTKLLTYLQHLRRDLAEATAHPGA